MWEEWYRLSLIAQLSGKLMEQRSNLSPRLIMDGLERIQFIALKSENFLENNKESIMNGFHAASVKLEEPNPNKGWV